MNRIYIPYPQTPASAREWLIAHGISQSEFARLHGVPRETVAQLLQGSRQRGLRGKNRRIAIALGLRPGDGNEPLLSGGQPG
ncbi:hypothetical protein BIY29_10085 [Brenneria alni]|uniref:DNA-binding protein n=1 Tax=Brenneria alni TaxID=71656 RepID=A0A421DNP3_9GAMM|nr:DNA-binding protein [Brenneria alni]RLM23642.1 hypothetical protein BIY29_10085 [Brenneria alni]